MKGSLKIKSTFDEVDSVDVVTTAEVEFERETLTITYSETEDGYSSTLSKLCVSNDIVSLNRFGQFPAQFIFVQGQTNLGNLTTPMGKMDASIFTHAIFVELDEKQLQLQLKYDMTIQGNCSFCNMKIECDFFGGTND